MNIPIGLIIKPLTYPLVTWLTNKVAQESTSSIKDIVCTAQGNIVEFRNFIGLEYRELDSLYDERTSIECSLRLLDDSEKVDKKTKKFLEDRMLEVESEFDDRIVDFEDKAIPMLCEFINDIEGDMLAYFEGREHGLPRLSLKMILHADTKTEDIFVEDIFRGNSKFEQHYWTKEFSVKENTAFSFLIADASQDKYLCNDIPKEIAKHQYKNSRINIEKAKRYSQGMKYDWKPIRAVFGKQPDEKWLKVWNKAGTSVLDKRSFYKSTLVVPIGFNGNQKLSRTVKLDLGAGQGSLPKGFLCLDHVYTNYFRDSDVKLAYIVADMFSILWQEYISFGDV